MSLTEDQARERLRERVESHGSYTAAGAAWGVSANALNDMVRGRRRLSRYVLRLIGLERVINYEERP